MNLIILLSKTHKKQFQIVYYKYLLNEYTAQSLLNPTNGHKPACSSTYKPLVYLTKLSSDDALKCKPISRCLLCITMQDCFCFVLNAP